MRTWTSLPAVSRCLMATSYDARQYKVKDFCDLCPQSLVFSGRISQITRLVVEIKLFLWTDCCFSQDEGSECGSWKDALLANDRRLFV